MNGVTVSWLQEALLRCHVYYIITPNILNLCFSSIRLWWENLQHLLDDLINFKKVQSKLLAEKGFGPSTPPVPCDPLQTATVMNLAFQCPGVDGAAGILHSAAAHHAWWWGHIVPCTHTLNRHPWRCSLYAPQGGACSGPAHQRMYMWCSP